MKGKPLGTPGTCAASKSDWIASDRQKKFGGAQRVDKETFSDRGGRGAGASLASVST